ncbi:sterol desaturase family protein [Methylobacterium brachiatum]|uniref:sterol desaturase family protein n=1 Tax=Methylobacterium brachiatum TaxID=269660 RepID=UPI002449DA14|nr:sterol desaturase family protein [Methylobacterium brachiatum]MDH2313344.1 sterol desaturase family protein [Methylobacterium brachiatum]
MSRAAYYTDFVAIPAVVLLLILVGGASFGGIAFGLAVWTLAEYVIHRFLFHRLPVFRDAHDLHHARPCARTGVTSWHSLAIFGALFLLLPAGILAGIALGYLAYITAHHAVHHWRIAPGHPLYALKMRHAMHHHGVEANFGVVTTLWDRVFRTYQARR